MTAERYQFEISQANKPSKRFDAEPGVYKIGTDRDCHMRLSSPGVDGRHAILTVRDGEFWVEDLDATSGTFVDGKRVSGRASLQPGQVIGIGPFQIVIKPAVSEPSAAPATPLVPPAPKPRPPVAETRPAPEPVSAPAAPVAAVAGMDERERSIKQQIHKELVERLDIKRLTASRIQADEMRQRARKTIEDIVADVRDRLPPDVKPDDLVREIFAEALGLGPLEPLLEDEGVTEIMVNGPRQIYVERNGRIELTGKSFMDDASVLAIVERIVSPLGRRIDESQPYVDARLPDGSRVNAIIHPLSLVGPCLTIRKFSKTPMTDRDLVTFGTWSQSIADFARICVLLRKNIIVSGGTGSGKTTLLNVLSSYIPDSERIVTIEDAAELRMDQMHIVRLEARPPNIEGRGAITIRDLVRNALRMRPDRIVVGECRGGEALDMLQAMNTGHDGSLTTVHANAPRDVISRLETMVLMSGMDLPVRAIREQIASAIDLIVHEARFNDGSRKITKVAEVVGLEGDQITMQDIFEFVQTGVDAKGKVVGHFRPTGNVPTFLEDIKARGLALDHGMFDPQKASRQA